MVALRTTCQGSFKPQQPEQRSMSVLLAENDRTGRLQSSAESRPSVVAVSSPARPEFETPRFWGIND